MTITSRIQQEHVPVNLGDDRIEPGYAQVAENPVCKFVTYTPNQNLTKHILKLVEGTQPQSMPRDDVAETHAFAVKMDRADGAGVELRKSWWWNDDWGHEGMDVEYDMSGLVFTINGAMDTWRNVSPVFKRRLADNAATAKRRSEEFATHFDGETLAIFPLTKTALETIEGFEGKGVVMKATNTVFATTIAILPDAALSD